MIKVYLWVSGGKSAINWVIAATGAEGLQLARELHPDLVVLDLMLPDIPGRDVFMQMRADPELRDIPVWVLSVIWWKANLDPWKDRAIVSYTFKPFDAFQFRDRVLEMLGLENTEKRERIAGG